MGPGGKTTATAFSSQSVMTLASADTGALTATQAPITATGIERVIVWTIDGRMFSSAELQRLEICNSLRSQTHVLARSASACLAAAVLPRALYNSASPKY